MSRRAFSLVELSIVLVILGLLTGGILSGKSLIRASQVRAFTNEIERFSTAHYTFKDKYFQMPGDLSNAVQFWGAADGTTGETVACKTVDALTASSPTATCNGDGDGRIIESVANTDERYRYWQHMVNAGLVEGRYAGIAGSENGNMPGYNVPMSKLGGMGHGVGWWPSGSISPVISGSTTIFDGVYGTVFVLHGGRDISLTPPQRRFAKAEELWNIDTKMDDGRPATGKIRARKGFTGCTLNDDTTPVYDLSNSEIACNGVRVL